MFFFFFTNSFASILLSEKLLRSARQEESIQFLTCLPPAFIEKKFSAHRLLFADGWMFPWISLPPENVQILSHFLFLFTLSLTVFMLLRFMGIPLYSVPQEFPSRSSGTRKRTKTLALAITFSSLSPFPPSYSAIFSKL